MILIENDNWKQPEYQAGTSLLIYIFPSLPLQYYYLSLSRQFWVFLVYEHSPQAPCSYQRGESSSCFTIFSSLICSKKNVKKHFNLWLKFTSSSSTSNLVLRRSASKFRQSVPGQLHLMISIIWLTKIKDAWYIHWYTLWTSDLIVILDESVSFFWK